MTIRDLQSSLIFSGLIIVPFLTYGELVGLFSGTLPGQGQNLTGWFKASKDLIFMLLIFLGCAGYLLSNKVKYKSLIYLLVVLLATAPSIILSLQNQFIYTASGLRWLIPVILPFFIYSVVDEALVKKIAKYLIVLLILHFCVQVLQAFYASSWYGVSSMGINLRNPGLFLIPNTASFFTIISLYFILYFADVNKLKKMFLVMVSIASVFLTMSGTGIVVLFILLLIYYFQFKFIKFFPLILPAVIGLGFVFISILLSSRTEEYLSVSGGVRLSILTNSFNNTSFFSDIFGYGTNTAIIMANGLFVDSTFASLVVNLGYFGFFIFMCLFLAVGVYSILNKFEPLFALLVIVFLYSGTNIIFEVYPVSLLLAILVAFFMKRRAAAIAARKCKVLAENIPHSKVSSHTII